MSARFLRLRTARLNTMAFTVVQVGRPGEIAGSCVAETSLRRIRECIEVSVSHAPIRRMAEIRAGIPRETALEEAADQEPGGARGHPETEGDERVHPASTRLARP